MTPLDSRAHERVLRRNVAIGVVGLLARGVHLALLLVIGGAFGPATLGQFLLGVGLFEIAAAVVVSGFSDGTMLLVSRHEACHPTRAQQTDELAEVVATALLLGGAVAVALAVLATAVAGWLTGRLTGPYADLLPGAIFLACSLIPVLVARVAFAATTAFLRLEWEAIVGAAGPALGVLAAVPVVRAQGGGVAGLFAALLAAQTLVALVALFVLGRHLRIATLRAALRRRRLHIGILKFAVPQAFNMAATTYIGRLDVLMLAVFGTPAAVIGAYGTVAALILELRQVRVVVSGGLGGLVARAHVAGARAHIARTLSRTTAWVTSIAVPIVLGFIVVRKDVVALVAPAYQGDSRFVLALLFGPLVNCMGGLAGNFLVYMLRNRWNLANSVIVAVANTVLCWFMVPRLGIMGAAISGTLAIGMLTVLENLGLAILESVYIAPGVLLRAALTMAGGVAVLWATDSLAASATWPVRVNGAAAMVAVAAVVIRRWPRPRALYQVGVGDSV